MIKTKFIIIHGTLAVSTSDKNDNLYRITECAEGKYRVVNCRTGRTILKALDKDYIVFNS